MRPNLCTRFRLSVATLTAADHCGSPTLRAPIRWLNKQVSREGIRFIFTTRQFWSSWCHCAPTSSMTRQPHSSAAAQLSRQSMFKDDWASSMHLIWTMLTPVRVLKVEGIDLFGERVPPSPTSRHHHIKITQKAMERGQGFREKEWQGRMDLRHQASGLTPLLLCVVVRTTHCACGLRRLDGPCSCMFTFFCRTGRIQIVQIGALFSPSLRFVLILLQFLAPVSRCHWLRESMLSTHT